MSNENDDFYDLLNSIVNEQTFQLDLCSQEIPKTVTCKQLTTAQLTELIKTVVDSPFTLSTFNSTTTKVFKDSLIEDVPLKELNVIDRLLFLLETRIQSLSPSILMTNDDNKTVEIPIQQVKENLIKSIKDNIKLLQPLTVSHSKFTLTVGTPDLEAESLLNEEIYKNVIVDVENKDELRSLLGEAFVYEIAKYLKSLTLDNNKTLDFSTVSFKERTNILQTLPAFLIQQIVGYIEKQKNIIDESLVFEGFYLSVDSTFFSLR